MEPEDFEDQIQERIARNTPTRDELARLARENPPPDSWWEEGSFPDSVVDDILKTDPEEYGRAFGEMLKGLPSDLPPDSEPGGDG